MGTSRLASIRYKTVILVILVSVLTVLTSISVSYMLTSREINHEIDHRVTAITEKLSAEVNGWMKEQSRYLTDIVETIEFNGMYDKDTLQKYVNDRTKNHTDTIAVFIGFEDKTFIEGSGASIPSDYNPKERDWYKDAIGKEEIVYSSPYLDANTNKIIISISKSIKNNGKHIGVVGIDISLDKLNEIITKESVDGSYAYLLDRVGNIVIHPNDSFKPKEDGLVNIQDINTPEIVDAVSSASKAGGSKIYWGNRL